jgi:hypothetical protein
LDEILQIFTSQSFDLRRPSSQKHQGLLVWSNLFNNLLDLRLKTHVENLVLLDCNSPHFGTRIFPSGAIELFSSAYLTDSEGLIHNSYIHQHSRQNIHNLRDQQENLSEQCICVVLGLG